MQIKLNGHVAICIPCLDKPYMEFTMSLSAMFWHLGKHSVPTVTCLGQSSIITHARDNILDAVEDLERKNVKIEWCFFLDSDMIFPNDVLFHLLSHQKDIVGCTYVRRTPPYDVHGRTLEGKMTVVDTGVMEVAALPTGCLLV